MGRITEKFVIALLAVFLLATVIYQLYISFYGGTATETVYEYTVSRSIPAHGIAIRQEMLVQGGFSGISHYRFEDGERVSIGESVAEFYESDVSDRNLRRVRELEKELAMLQSAEEIGVNNFPAAEMINRDIKEQLAFLTFAAENRNFERAEDIRFSLTALINKKKVATGMSSGYTPRISEIKAELAALNEQERGSDVLYVAAPASGYFVKDADGWESLVSPGTVEDYKAEDFLGLLDAPEPEDPALLDAPPTGKIIRSQNWLFAAAADKTSLEFVKPGQMLDLEFKDINAMVPAYVTEIYQEKDVDEAVLLLSCNQVSGPLLGVRRAEVTMSFDQYTGLRVDVDDLRFMGEKRGVYVLDGGVARFKELAPVYEEAAFVLSRFFPPNPQDKSNLKLFDQIIVKGKDIYDGKTIQ